MTMSSSSLPSSPTPSTPFVFGAGKKTTTNNDNANKGISSSSTTTTTTSTTTTIPTLPPVPKTKCCVICHQEHETLDVNGDLFHHDDHDDDDDENTAVSSFAKKGKGGGGAGIVLACGHIFCRDQCAGMGRPADEYHVTIDVLPCRVCGKIDPGIGAFANLPYVKDLMLVDKKGIDASVDRTLLQLMYHEWSMRRTYDAVEALDKAREHELKVCKKERDAAMAEHKKAIDDDAARHHKKNGKVDTKKAQIGKRLKEATALVDAKFEPRLELIERKHDMQWRSIARAGELTQLQVDLEAKVAALTKAIQKHYRKASIKVHPDRHPDRQVEFDNLTRAKDTLMDEELRKTYFDQMMEIIVTVGVYWITSSHRTWVVTHQPEMARRNPSTTKKDSKPVAIEGGLMYSKPRKPGFVILNANERRVRVTLRVPSNQWHDFYGRCHSIIIVGQRASSRKDKLYTQTFLKEDLIVHAAGEINIEITLNQFGDWSVWWRFTNQIDIWWETTNQYTQQLVTSQDSDEGHIHLTSPKYLAQLARVRSYREVAFRRSRNLFNIVHKVDANGAQKLAIELCENFQKALLSAKHTLFHLKKAMDAVGADTDGDDSTTPYANLRSAVARAEPYQESIAAVLHYEEKRATKNNFKQTVYNILETGNGGFWLADLTAEELKQEGGDANRLYQLLMDGKKAYRTDLVDGSTLSAAVSRPDLFSEKQIKSLAERAEEIEALAAEEARQISAEAEKREKEQKAREEIAKHASVMERGSTVQIKGLKSEASLNGRLAVYMGLHIPPSGIPSGRHLLRLNENRDIALRQVNFEKWDGLQSNTEPPLEFEPWACVFCTYVHEGTESKLTSCAMCGASPEGERLPSSMDENMMASAAGAPAEQPVPVQPEAPAAPSRPSLETGTLDSIAMSPPVETSLQAKAAKAPQPPLALPSPPTPKRQASIALPQRAGSSAQPSLASPTSPPHIGSQHSGPVISGSQLYHQQNDPRFRTRPCKLGSRCARILNGSCNFLHSEEETVMAFQRAGKKIQSTPSRQIVPTLNSSSPTAGTASTSTPTSPNTSTNTSSVERQETPSSSLDVFERTVMIDARAVNFLYGRKKMNVRDICVRSKAKVTILPLRDETDRLRPVLIKGPTASSVQSAADLVSNRVSKFVPRFRPDSAREVGGTVNATDPSNASLSVSSKDVARSVPMEIHGGTQVSPQSQQPVHAAPLVAAPASSRKDDLMSFVESQTKALKCSPTEFVEWLKGEDISTLSDLVEACEDEDFVSEIVENGLKKFKLQAFRKSAASIVEASSV